jgi:hypothetical protein
VDERETAAGASSSSSLFLSKFEGGAGLLDLQASFGETSRAAAQNTVITSQEVGNGKQSG